MIRYPALSAVRVGCVQYLNSKPLIHGCDAPVVFDHPSGLARDLVEGRLDVALVPVFEALRHPPWLAVDDVAIACDGPVFSVFLAHRGPLVSVRRIALDPASRTSVHLLQVLLAEFHDLHPEYIAGSAAALGAGLSSPAEGAERAEDTRPGEDSTPGRKARRHDDAQLLIGNQAIDFRLAHPDGWHFLDLGEEWKRCTDLPFVFALWLMRPSQPSATAIADELRAIKSDGLAHLPKIVRADSAHDPIFAMRYLTEHIRFDYGPREKAGLDMFRELLEKHRLVAADGQRIQFV